MSRNYLERVACANAEKVAQIGAQRYSGALSARATAELYAGYAKGCAGDCGRSVISPEMHSELSKRAQRILYELNIRVAHENGACKLCVVKVRKQKEPRKLSRDELVAQRRQKVANLWEEVRTAGGGRRELAEALGVSRQAVDYFIKKYDLPPKDGRSEGLTQFIEELEHLNGLGMGVGYIARALRMTPEALVKKVDHLHYLGKTEVKFHGWQERYQKEEAA